MQRFQTQNPEVPEADRMYLSQNGYDIGEEMITSHSGWIFRGMCNERAFKSSEESGVRYHQRIPLAGQRCAIKWMSPLIRLTTNRDILKEAAVLSYLNHPNVVELYFVGTTDLNNTYLCFEYVNGDSLASLYKAKQSSKGKISATLLNSMLTELVDALSYMHSMGIEHGSIQMAKIMTHQYDPYDLSKRQIKFCDFSRAVISRDIDPEEGEEADFGHDIQLLGGVFEKLLQISNITNPSVSQHLWNLTNRMANGDYQDMNTLSNDLTPILQNIQ